MRCNLVVSKVYGIALESIAKVNRFQRVWKSLLSTVRGIPDFP